MGHAAPYVAVVGAGAGVPPELVAAAEAVGAELARRAGGMTLGILPGSDRRSANPFVEVAVATGMGELRNGLVVRSADALVAIAGGAGTLSEIALALKAGKRVIGIGTWEIEGVQAAADAAEAVALALAER